jgi:excisionase family DNA binding protein
MSRGDGHGWETVQDFQAQQNGGRKAQKVVGDGRQLRTAEAAERLNVSESTVVKWERDGLLRAMRTAGGGRGRGHRRIDADSVAELQRVLAMPDGPDRDATLEDLRRRNRGGGASPSG